MIYGFDKFEQVKMLNKNKNEIEFIRPGENAAGYNSGTVYRSALKISQACF